MSEVLDMAAKIKTPLTYWGALELAQAALDGPVMMPPSESIVKALMAVDVASRAQWRSECYDVLNSVAEYLDDHVDVVDGDEESGPRPNRAMQLLQDVEMLMGKVRE